MNDPCSLYSSFRDGRSLQALALTWPPLPTARNLEAISNSECENRITEIAVARPHASAKFYRPARSCTVNAVVGHNKGKTAGRAGTHITRQLSFNAPPYASQEDLYVSLHKLAA